MPPHIRVPSRQWRSAGLGKGLAWRTFGAWIDAGLSPSARCGLARRRCCNRESSPSEIRPGFCPTEVEVAPPHGHRAKSVSETDAHTRLARRSRSTQKSLAGHPPEPSRLSGEAVSTRISPKHGSPPGAQERRPTSAPQRVQMRSSRHRPRARTSPDSGAPRNRASATILRRADERPRDRDQRICARRAARPTGPHEEGRNNSRRSAHRERRSRFYPL